MWQVNQVINVVLFCIYLLCHSAVGRECANIVVILRQRTERILLPCAYWTCFIVRNTIYVWCVRSHYELRQVRPDFADACRTLLVTKQRVTFKLVTILNGAIGIVSSNRYCSSLQVGWLTSWPFLRSTCDSRRHRPTWTVSSLTVSHCI